MQRNPVAAAHVGRELPGVDVHTVDLADAGRVGHGLGEVIPPQLEAAARSHADFEQADGQLRYEWMLFLSVLYLPVAARQDSDICHKIQLCQPAGSGGVGCSCGRV
jgi:hypothetical protein